MRTGKLYLAGGNMKQTAKFNRIKEKRAKASLTVEASLVLPLFLFFFLSFLYFIQIITVQGVIQEALTETGLSMARAAYIYSDFQDAEDVNAMDLSPLEEGIKTGLEELAGIVIHNIAVKYALGSRLNEELVNTSCIAGGFDGMRFDGSEVFEGDNDIDIVIRYRVRIPVRIFGLHEMDMIQRIRVRGWNGNQIPALYRIAEEEDKEETIVYITKSGTVYHLDRDCTHIRLSIEEIHEKPTWHRNKNGGRYYACEACCSNDPVSGSYYITVYGDRYHRRRDCSKIKRTVQEIPLSEVGEKVPCKRCNR